MTESEARSKIKYRIEVAREIAGNGVDGKAFEDLEIAIQALKEIREYRAMEERLNGISVEQVVDGFIKQVENETQEEYKQGRILTNKESENWNEYRAIGTVKEFKALKEKNRRMTMMEIQAINELDYLLGYENAIDKGYIEEENHLNSEEKEALKFILDEIRQYRAIGTVEEVKMLKDFKELYDAYNLIGTIEEFRKLKYKKNVLPIATIEFSKEDMQKIVDEKVAQIELDIQEIRNKAIDEFVKEIEAEYDNDGCPNVSDYLDYKISIRDLQKIAEHLKGGATDARNTV